MSRYPIGAMYNILRWSIATSIVLFIIFKNFSKRSFELFDVNASNAQLLHTNISDLPWEKHPITTESTPTDTPIKYKRAYYFEMSNDDFYKALQKTFANNCKSAKEVIIAENWIIMNPREVSDDEIHTLELYPKIIEFIKNMVNKSLYMKLTNETPYIIQIVHDVLISAQKHNSNPGQYVFNIELIMYREFAAHGKHISMKVFIEPQNIVVVQLDVLGIVPSEIIGMHPVLPNDTIDMEQQELVFDANPLAPFPTTLLTLDTINHVVDKQLRKQQADADAIKAIA